MYFRTSTIKGRTYLLLVEAYRENGKARQRTIASFGLLEDAISSGKLERLLLSGERYVKKLVILSEAKNGDITPLSTKKIGAYLIFRRLWNDLGINSVISSCSDGRNFGFSMERVLFAAVLQRLVNPDSDRAGVKWLLANQLDCDESIRLHQLYRAMKWLGEPLKSDSCGMENEADDRVSDTKASDPVKGPKCVRCTKDLLEEEIYFKRRDLFSSLELYYFDTTSLYFEGAGGDELGRRGHSKDHRPDLNQVILGMVSDNFGTPVFTEIWPGNTSDVTTLRPVSDRLQKRFHANGICVIADRGMISKNAIEQIEKKNWSYILGARMRQEKELQVVMADDGPYEEVTGERVKSNDPAPLKVKEIKVGGNRYVVCINEEEARKDKYDREAILKSLEEALRKGDKALIGNKGYKRFVKANRNSFEIDKVKAMEEEKYDGKFVLKTNLTSPASEIAIKYKQLLMVETIFRTSKSTLQTRPIHHQCDEAIRGHIWCSFLALLLRKTLMDAMGENQKEGEVKVEWKDLINDLEMLTYSKIQIKETSFELRSEACPGAKRAFRALGMKLPDHIKFDKTKTED
ncbi:MAG: IS1634 family transposase [Deltaproteobacteria bacterium]|nr:IS1634 family transposase [Deltaproteobacteria bacterium]